MTRWQEGRFCWIMTNPDIPQITWGKRAKCHSKIENKSSENQTRSLNLIQIISISLKDSLPVGNWSQTDECVICTPPGPVTRLKGNVFVCCAEWKRCNNKTNSAFVRSGHGYFFNYIRSRVALKNWPKFKFPTNETKARGFSLWKELKGTLPPISIFLFFKRHTFSNL